MKGIVWKIFLPVLLAMASLVFLSLILLANFGSRISQNAQQNIPQQYEEAKDVLLESGEAGLKNWLNNNKSIGGLRIFIIDRNENDLLNRTLPPPHELIRGMNRDFRNRANDRTVRKPVEGPRSRTDRDATKPIEGPRSRTDRRTGRYPMLRSDKQSYRFLLARPAGGIVGVLKSQRTFLPILIGMLLLSALVSALIAKKISQPIQKLRHGVQRISSGDLKAKISSDLSHRQDEIGDLANDFDEMTEKLSSLLSTQQKLLRDVSHELRSPLARLQVALGLAEKRSGAEISPELQRIETEANTLNEMIGKILSLVRLNNLSIDNSSLQFEEIDLVGLLKSLVANADYEGQEKSVKVDFTSPSSHIVKAVPNLLSSAIENVLRNAVKYATDNSEVNCNLEQVDNKLLLSISNSGINVPEDELDKIFEPFYRVSKTREHQQGSGGIGLAIARQAVEIHAGTIKAENLDKGLRVTMSFPF